MTCRHPHAARRTGPRVPARWGSFATEVCTKCGKWRHFLGGLNSGRHFRPPVDLVLALVREDDE